MRLMTEIAMMSTIFATVVSGFRHRPQNLYCARKTSRMMSAYIPRTELRFGQSLHAKDLEVVVNAFAFDIYIKKLSSHLERTDKPAFEWFERFLFEIPAEDDDHFELHVMKKLMTAHAFILENEMKSPVNTDVSLSFSHCVEPCLLATLLLDGKKEVLKEMISLLPLVLKENNEAATYAYGRFKYGWAGRSTNTIDRRDSNLTSSNMDAFHQLNLLVTNLALGQVEDALKIANDREGLDYLSSAVRQMLDNFLAPDLMALTKTHPSAKARRGDQAAIYNINRDFLDLLLQQGYTDLAGQDITHQDIEKVLDFEGNEAMKDPETAGVYLSKKTSQKSIQKYEENETLKLAIDKVASHRISQDMIAFRASTCNSLGSSFMRAVLTISKGELELILRIKGCPVIPGTNLMELIDRTLDKSIKNAFKGADYVFLELTNRGSAALTAMSDTNSIGNSISSTSDSDSASDSVRSRDSDNGSDGDSNSASDSDGDSNSDSDSDGDRKAFEVAAQLIGDIEELGPIQEPDTFNTGKENDEDLDLDAALVSAGNPQLFSAGAGTDAASDNKGSKGGDDHIGISISELLGSIFSGFRGRGDRGGSGSETDGKDDAPETVTEPQGERQKTSTAILDPPGSDLPPRKGKKYIKYEDKDEDAVEKRKAVNWGLEFPEGDLSDFLALGPNARIRYISQKEELGQKYICLEGKSMERNANGSPATVLKMWVNYNEALELLKNGFQDYEEEGEENTETDNITDYSSAVTSNAVHSTNSNSNLEGTVRSSSDTLKGVSKGAGMGVGGRSQMM